MSKHYVVDPQTAVLRSRIGGLAKHRDAADPLIAQTRQELHEHVLLEAVERAIAAAPAMRPETRDRILGLLSTTPDVSGEVA